jgi:nucleoid DNA-binding protein
LNPTKRKEISKITSEALGLDHLVVDDIVAFFYRSVQKKLSAVNHSFVNVPNMGTFVLKRQRVEKKLEKYEAFLNKIDASESIGMYETSLEVKADIEKYKSILEFMDQENVRKEEVKKLKQNYIDNVEQRD